MAEHDQIVDSGGMIVAERRPEMNGRVVGFRAKTLLDRPDVRNWLDDDCPMLWPYSHYRDRMICLSDGECDLASDNMPEWLHKFFTELYDAEGGEGVMWVHLEDVGEAEADCATMNTHRLHTVAGIFRWMLAGLEEPLDGDEVDTLLEPLKIHINLNQGNITAEESREARRVALVKFHKLFD